MIPNAKDQPQLTIRCRLAMENTISEAPPMRKETANKIAKVINELKGEVNTTILTMTKKIPTNSGMYQCLMASLIDFKNKVCKIR